MKLKPIINMKLRETYGKCLVDLAKRHNNLVVLDADMVESCGLQYFQKEVPDRFINVGIAEQNMVGIAAGLAASGKIPFVNSFACFLTTRACDQIRVSVAFTQLNVKIIGGHGGISVGEDGATAQALEDVAIMRAMPNMVVIVPACVVEMATVMDAIMEYEGPVYIRLARPSIEQLFDNNYRFRIGHAPVLRRGTDATIMAMGIMVSRAIAAADILKSLGLSVGVINISTIKPIDKETILRAAVDTGAIVTVEDHSIIGGLGSAVAEVLSEECPTLMQRIGIPDTFGESGPSDDLLKKYGLTANNVAEVTKVLVSKKTN